MPDTSNAISIKSLTYDYGSGPIILDVPLFEVPSGARLFLRGPSGSGKSTLIDLILGLLKTNEGKILIDEKNLYENLEKWQPLIGYIPQDIYLVDDTILKNVAYGVEDKLIDQNKVEQALQDAQIHDFVKSLPSELKTVDAPT